MVGSINDREAAIASDSSTFRSHKPDGIVHIKLDPAKSKCVIKSFNELKARLEAATEALQKISDAIDNWYTIKLRWRRRYNEDTDLVCDDNYGESIGPTNDLAQGCFYEAGEMVDTIQAVLRTQGIEGKK